MKEKRRPPIQKNFFEGFCIAAAGFTLWPTPVLVETGFMHQCEKTSCGTVFGFGGWDVSDVSVCV